LYTEASSPANAGDKSKLESKEFKATEGRCLSFWYHMYGVGMGSLNVNIQDVNGVRQIWKQLGDKGNQWQLGSVTITSKIPYKVSHVTLFFDRPGLRIYSRSQCLSF